MVQHTTQNACQVIVPIFADFFRSFFFSLYPSVFDFVPTADSYTHIICAKGETANDYMVLMVFVSKNSTYRHTHTLQFSRGFDQNIMKWEKRMIIEKKIRIHIDTLKDNITSINKSVTVCWHEQLDCFDIGYF